MFGYEEEEEKKEESEKNMSTKTESEDDNEDGVKLIKRTRGKGIMWIKEPRSRSRKRHDSSSDIKKGKEERVKASPKRMYIKEPGFRSESVVKPKHDDPVLSLEEVNRRSNAFFRGQREKYRSYLTFLMMVLQKKNERLLGKPILMIFNFEKRSFARSISVLTESPRGHLGRCNLHTVTSLAKGWKLTYFNDYTLADSVYHRHESQNMMMSRIPELAYQVSTYVIDVIPFNPDAGFQLFDPFPNDDGDDDMPEPFVGLLSDRILDDGAPRLGRVTITTDPRDPDMKIFLSLSRIAARVHKSGGSIPPTLEQVELRKKNNMSFSLFG